MKYSRTVRIEKEGVLFLASVVNRHGSKFVPIPQPEDTGLDGFIEFVEEEEATGEILFVQVKSGQSYLSPREHSFSVACNKAHFAYWFRVVAPVILVAYDPTTQRRGPLLSHQREAHHVSFTFLGKKLRILIEPATREGKKGIAGSFKPCGPIIGTAKQALSGRPTCRHGLHEFAGLGDHLWECAQATAICTTGLVWKSQEESGSQGVKGILEV